ncbi:unnamed protein product [Durusdinium trenchii]|uniref:VAN3-binding protein-like auxin canalisation domain-containing protein n=1 Tax=Durusdinium trenchii TaxID=1381693 RepID=A0ABP0KS68_9DINO
MKDEATSFPSVFCRHHVGISPVIGTADSAANRTVDVTRSMWSRLVHASSAAKVSSAASMAELAQEASRASTWVAASPLAQSGAQQAKATKCRAMACCAAAAHSLAGVAEVIAESAEKASSMSQQRSDSEEK